MAFNDYFNSDNNDDDDNELEESEYIPQLEININGKHYNSIEQVRKEATDEELVEYRNFYDKKIIKTEEILKRADTAFKIFGAFAAVGLGSMVFKGFFPGMLKNVLDLLAPASLGFGLISMFFNFKKYKPVEDELDDLYCYYDEIDEEIMLRDAQRHVTSKEKEIFPDIFEEELVKAGE